MGFRKQQAVLCLVLVGLVTSCAARGAQVATIPPKPPAEPLAWLPDESTMMARVTLEAWRATPLWKVAESMSQQGAWADLIDLALLDEVVVGGELKGPADREGGPAAGFVTVLKGRFGAGYLEKRLATRSVAPEVLGPLTFYTVDASSFVQVSDELLIACSESAREHVRARYEGKSTSRLRAGHLFQTLAPSSGFEQADLAVLAEDANARGLSAFTQGADAVGLAGVRDEVGSIALSLAWGKEVVLVAISETADSPAAEHLERSITDSLRALERNLFVGLLGLRGVVAGLKVARQDNLVTVRGAFAESEIRALLTRAAGLIEVAMTQQGNARLPVLSP